MEGLLSTGPTPSSFFLYNLESIILRDITIVGFVADQWLITQIHLRILVVVKLFFLSLVELVPFCQNNIYGKSFNFLTIQITVGLLGKSCL